MPTPSRLRLIPIVVVQAIGFACGVASVRLNSHLIPPAELGLYGIFLTFTPVGMWVIYAGLLNYMGRHWAAATERPGLLRELRTAWTRRLPAVALFAALGAVCIAGLGAGGTLLLAVALAISAALLALAAFAQAALQAEGAHWRDCAVGATGSVTRSFLPPLLFALSGGWAASLWLGFTVHTVAMAGVGAWMLRKWWRQPPDATGTAVTLPAVYQGKMFTALALANWIVSGLNRWLIAWRFGEVPAGYYTLAGGAALVVTSMLGVIILQYCQPGFFALGDGPASERARLARRVDLAALAYTTLAYGALGLVVLVAPHLIGPLISPAYRDALPWLFPAGCFGIAIMVTTIYRSLLLAGRRERACGPVDISTAAVLATGCLAATLAGPEWLRRWLIVAPAVPWLLTRRLARHYFFKPDAPAAP